MMTEMSTGPPTITTHPTSSLTIVNTRVILNCWGSGKGSIMYKWQTRRNTGGPWWTDIRYSNNSGLIIRKIHESQQYRCVLSNEAGRTISKVATITVLSE